MACGGGWGPEEALWGTEAWVHLNLRLVICIWLPLPMQKFTLRGGGGRTRQEGAQRPKGKWEGRPLPTLLPLTPVSLVYHGKRTLFAPRRWYPPPPWPSGAGAATPHPTQAHVPPRGGHARNAKSRPRIHFPHFISVQLLDSPEASAAPPAPARAVRRRGPGQAGDGRRRAGGTAAVSPRLVSL